MKKYVAAIIIYSVITLLLITSAKAAERLTIYVDDGNADYLVQVIVTGEKEVNNLVELLEEYQMVPIGTKVNSFAIVRDNTKGIGYLDLSSEYENALNQTGTAGETMYIFSVVNTMIANFQLDEIVLTVEGEIISTGHSIYDTSLTFYDHVIKATNWNVHDPSTLSSVSKNEKTVRINKEVMDITIRTRTSFSLLSVYHFDYVGKMKKIR